MRFCPPITFPEERGNSVRRIVALFLSLMLFIFLIPAGMAEQTEADEIMSGKPDFSCFTDHPEYFRKDVSEDGTIAFIQTQVPAEYRAFSTPYENDIYYSTIFPELMIRGWSEEKEQTPFFRIWIRYRGTKHLNISAVSVIIDGTDYRFENVSSPEWIATKEDGTAAQDVMLVLGSNQVNATCFAALFSKAIEYTQERLNNQDTPMPDVSFILHGDENTEITLPADFWAELAMFAYNLDAINGFSSLTSTTGTFCMIQK